MRNSTEFKQMNEWQKKAICRTKGPMLVTAGPGSGKTTVITYRVLNLLLEEGVSPQNVYVITFTKDAARSMSARFYRICTSYNVDASYFTGQVFFGTYHSLFFQIMKSHYKYKDSQLIGEEGKQGLLVDVWKQLFAESIGSRGIQRILAAISLYKNTGKLSPDTFEVERFLRLYEGYEARKRALNCIDFDDMLLGCKEMLKSDNIFCRQWQEKMKYILVDEFQDTNQVQYDVLRLLAHRNRNLCVVGDDDQAIYGFRGARPGIMQEFMKDFPGFERVDLSINYRSVPDIVKATGRLIACNKNRLNKQLSAYKKESGTAVALKEFSNRREMDEALIEALRGKKESELSESAILFRTNSRMSLFRVLLIRAGIPFVTKEKADMVYDHFIARDIMDYFKVAHGEGGREVLLRVLNKPRLSIGREALISEKVTPEEIVRFYEGRRECLAAYQDAVRFRNGMRMLKSMSLSQGITFIYRYFGYESYLLQKANRDATLLGGFEEVITFLKEDASYFNNFHSWESFQRECRYKEKERKAAKEMASNGVHVMTLHASKGLEFKHVFIYEVNEENIPKKRKGEELTQEALEEERRLLYVGMTRAKEALELCYTCRTESSPKPPSRFLKELAD